jgi:hypothetical protein
MTLFAIKAKLDSLLTTYKGLQNNYTKEALIYIDELVLELNERTTSSPTYWDIDELMDDLEEAMDLLVNEPKVPVFAASSVYY